MASTSPMGPLAVLSVSLTPKHLTISGMFFEADLHTDRLSANKQRNIHLRHVQVSSNYSFFLCTGRMFLEGRMNRRMSSSAWLQRKWGAGAGARSWR